MDVESKASRTLRETAFLLLVTDLTDYIKDLIHPHASAAHPVRPLPSYFMFLITPLLFLAIASHARHETRRENEHSEYLRTCHKIGKDISSASQVFFPRARPFPFQ